MNSFLSVFVGLLATLLLSVGTDAVMHALGVFPPIGHAMSAALLGLVTAYRIVGGYITARFSRTNTMRNAFMLGLIGTVFSIAGLVAAWNAGPELGPKWYPALLVFTALPSCWIGAKFHKGVD